MKKHAASVSRGRRQPASRSTRADRGSADPALADADAARDPSGRVDPTLGGIASALTELAHFLRHRYMPQLWDYRDIAKWMKVSETTVKMRVVNQDGFPDPFVPTGNEDGHRRYFSDDVIAFARRRRGADN